MEKQHNLGKLDQSAIDENSKQEAAEGVASVVCRAKYNPQSNTDGYKGSLVAIKSSTANRRFSPEPHDIVKEIAVLSSVSHANIIPILHASLNKSSYRWELITPWIPHSLDDLLNIPSFSPHECPSMLRHLILPLRIPSSPEEEKDEAPARNPPSAQSIFDLLIRSIIYQTSLAISFLHNHAPEPIAHRDIKPRNLLLTETGRVQLIDFGIAYEKQMCTQKDVLWPESEDAMYSDVATGPYRAPELLFGARKYDACATDLWSLGALIAQFFTPLILTKTASLYHPFSSSLDAENDDDDDDDLRDVAPVNGYIISPRLKPQLQSILSFNVEWDRQTLFDASRGTIGLAWSVFKVFGTPTKESWPEFEDMPDANKLQFMHTDGVPLHSRLPNLLPTEPTSFATTSETKADSNEKPLDSPVESRAAQPTALDLIKTLLVYSPRRRLKIAEVLKHGWLIRPEILLLPMDHPGSGAQRVAGNGDREWFTEWHEEDVGCWLRVMLGKSGKEER